MDLLNRVIINTRPEKTNDELSDLLSGAGATVLSLPMIMVNAAPEPSIFMEVFDKLELYNWLIFTSRNGVIHFFDLLKYFKMNYNLPALLKIATVGKATANELSNYGTRATFVSSKNNADEMIGDLLLNHLGTNEKVLLALGNLAPDLIEKRISEEVAFANVEVKRINIYHTVKPENVNTEYINMVRRNLYDLIVFASPSSFQNFLEIAGSAFQHPLKIASIGKTTSREIVNNGYKPVITAEKSSGEGLFESIKDYFCSLNFQT